jgi:hypothetical protein
MVANRKLLSENTTRLVGVIFAPMLVTLLSSPASTAATERQGVATAGLFPRVSVSGFVGFLAARGSTFFAGDSRAYSVTPGLA